MTLASLRSRAPGTAFSSGAWERGQTDFILERLVNNRLTDIRDESGDVLLGVRPENCARWAVTAWRPKELIGLEEVVLVGDDISLKRHEKMLLTAGKRSVKVNGERSRMYWSSDGGLTQLINIKAHREPLLAGLQKKGLRQNLWVPLREFETGRGPDAATCPVKGHSGVMNLDAAAVPCNG